MIEAKSYLFNTRAVTEAQYVAHMQLYKGYVDKINEVTEKLNAEKPPIVSNATYSRYRGLKKGETYAAAGVILHEAYFQNMTAQETHPNENTLNALAKYFGSFEQWQDDFTNCAMSARGWCLLVYEQRTKSLRNMLLDLHDEGMVCLSFPILVLDMYEHAYFMDYGTDKSAYVKAFIKSICWETVGARLRKLSHE